MLLIFLFFTIPPLRLNRNKLELLNENEQYDVCCVHCLRSKVSQTGQQQRSWYQFRSSFMRGADASDIYYFTTIAAAIIRSRISHSSNNPTLMKQVYYRSVKVNICGGRLCWVHLWLSSFTTITWMNAVHWLKATLLRQNGLVRSSQSGWTWLDNSGWKPQRWWPTKLLTRCGEQCEFNWPRPWAVSGGQRVTSDNRERAGWLVNRGHGGLGGGGQRGAGHGVVAAQFTGAGVCSTEFLCFCFWYCRACSPPPKLDLGVHREVSCSVQSWRPLQCPAGGEGPGAFTCLLWWEPVYRCQNPDSG